MTGDADHMWRFRSVSFEDDGAYTEYECDLCDGVLLVPPNGTHPFDA